MDNLAACWEWDRVTGDPVFHHPPIALNRRYIPSVAEMPGLVFGQIVIDPVRATDLVRFMRSDERTTFFYFDTSRISRGGEGSLLIAFMTLLRALNLKKVAINYHGSGRLQMTKLPRDEPFTGEEHQLWLNNSRRHVDIQRDINRNALVGFLGPGTFPCNHPQCDLCTRTGCSAIVTLGPHGVLHLTKRATCAMSNVVYVGVCSRCEELGGEDDWCVYFGETRHAFRQRCRGHKSNPCNTANLLRDIRTAVARRDKLQRVIAGLDAEEGILQDWYSHIGFGGIHEGFQRMSVVDVIPLHVARVHRETGLVLQHMMRDGAIDYRGRGRGCVNTYHGY